MTDQPTLSLPNPGDWGTLAAAAGRLQVSVRTVGRMLESDVLHGYMLRVGETEQGRMYVWWPEVEEVARARERLSRS